MFGFLFFYRTQMMPIYDTFRRLLDEHIIFWLLGFEINRMHVNEARHFPYICANKIT